MPKNRSRLSYNIFPQFSLRDKTTSIYLDISIEIKPNIPLLGMCSLLYQPVIIAFNLDDVVLELLGSSFH